MDRYNFYFDYSNDIKKERDGNWVKYSDLPKQVQKNIQLEAKVLKLEEEKEDMIKRWNQGFIEHEIITELKSHIERLRGGITSVRELMDESLGVTGLHLNGDIATWDELEEGGRFEEWLTGFNIAEDYIKQLKEGK